MTKHLIEIVACNTCEQVLAAEVIPDGILAKHNVDKHGASAETSIFQGVIDTSTAASWIVSGIAELLANK